MCGIFVLGCVARLSVLCIYWGIYCVTEESAGKREMVCDCDVSVFEKKLF